MEIYDLRMTYPPSKRYKTHPSAEALHFLFHATVILVVVYIVIQGKPEDVLDK